MILAPKIKNAVFNPSINSGLINQLFFVLDQVSPTDTNTTALLDESSE